MIKRMLAVLAMVLMCDHAAPAQDSKPKPGAAPGALQPSAGGGTAQPGGQPSQPGGLGGGGGGFPGGGKKKEGGTASSGLPGGLGSEAFGAGVGAPAGMMGGFGQSQKKEKDFRDMTLEELLAKALKDNPDIRVAESKVREAEAELSRTRLEVLQKIARLQDEIQLARIVMTAADELHRQTMMSGATASAKDRIESRLTRDRKKGELAKLEAELPYLIGKQPAAMTGMGGAGGGMMAPGGMGSGAFPMPSGLPIGHYGNTIGPMAVSGSVTTLPATLTDKLRKGLDTQVTLNGSDILLSEAVDFLTGKMQGINVHVSDKKLNEAKVNLQLRQPVPIGAMLQLLEDELNCQCVIREYGIVIVQRDRVPPGATPLLEFWKKSRGTESKHK